MIPMKGHVAVEVGEDRYRLQRGSVFDDAGSLLYLPPNTPARLTTIAGTEIAIGTAPATGQYPVRLIRSEEVQVEIRGGGNARRQVNHLLAPPLPAERLIVYEVIVPGGSWPAGRRTATMA